jgi:hypothetical protein
MTVFPKSFSMEFISELNFLPLTFLPDKKITGQFSNGRNLVGVSILKIISTTKK